MQMMVQTRLKSGTNEAVVWLPVDSRVRVGSSISLDKRKGRWSVEEQYAVAPLFHIEFQRGWGLDLPKSQRTER